MPFDQNLAARIREAFGRAPLSPNDDVVEKQMFGGLAFMVSGAMCCGVLGELLLARASLADYERALTRPGVRPFTFGGRISRGFLYVEPAACATNDALDAWIADALRFLRSPEAAARKKASSRKRPTAARPAAKPPLAKKKAPARH